MELGEIREELSKDLANDLAKTIDLYQRVYNWYYLLVRATWEDTILHSKQIIMSDKWFAAKGIKPDQNRLKKRLAFYDTMLFFVDNRKGEFKMLHCLPQLIELPDDMVSEEKCPFIDKSNQDIQRSIVGILN